jgi:hypothetical protein
MYFKFLTSIGGDHGPILEYLSLETYYFNNYPISNSNRFLSKKITTIDS